jgi:rubrerythrin
MTFEDHLLSQRFTSAMSAWPTLDEAWACLDCRGMFRKPDNARCPMCNSESIFDVASVLNAERAN